MGAAVATAPTLTPGLELQPSPPPLYSNLGHRASRLYGRKNPVVLDLSKYHIIFITVTSRRNKNIHMHTT